MPFIEYEGKRILFIHIPKTGGSSVEQWLDSIGTIRLKSPSIPSSMKCTPQHLTFDDLSELFGSSYFDYSFAIVRHPYTRVESEYRWRLFTHQTQLPFSDWSARALESYKDNPWFRDNHFRPQIQFLGAPVQIHKFEAGLPAILNRVSRELGLPPPKTIPHEKRPDGLPRELTWTRELRSLVHEVYEQDFLALKYEQVEID